MKKKNITKIDEWKEDHDLLFDFMIGMDSEARRLAVKAMRNRGLAPTVTSVRRFQEANFLLQLDYNNLGVIDFPTLLALALNGGLDDNDLMLLTDRINHINEALETHPEGWLEKKSVFHSIGKKVKDFVKDLKRLSSGITLK